MIDNDGWFHTGDLGEFNQYGLLKITGRMKNLFKTSLGKYINPDIIERKFTESNFFENIVVFGENEKYAAALIIPDFDFIKSWCKKHEISYSNDHDMLNNQDVKTRLANEIKRINSFFGDTEKIKRYCFIEDSWTVANGILTPTLKVKRSVVKEKYSSLINKLFHAED